MEFDPCGPLPSGVTVLEASAGTGKTYTIAALTARYVAEGVPLERLLLVTFTRIATGELRERVRERLVSVERGLGRRLAGAPATDDEDPVVTLLTRGDAGRHRDNLARAVAGFDAATIATTHGFCQEMLGGLGIAGDLEPDVTFVEDLSDLVSDVVDDLYVRRFAPARGNPEGSPAFGRAEAASIARAAIDNPSARLVSADGAVPKMRLGLAEVARTELEERKRAMMVMTYDDLVTRLGTALRGPGGGGVAAQLRSRYEVVLVDEFQDTDPAQWEIMRLAFGEGGATLVLIADPKQAIYAFRGADVYAYLDAARAAGRQATLPINWRSDQGLIDAHDALFSGVKLGHEGIAYRQVRAADEHQEPGLSGAPVASPLRLRVALREDLPQTPRGYARAGDARRHVVCDVAADIVRAAELGRPGGGGPSPRRRDRAGPARARGRAGAHQPPGGDGPRGARGRRRARGDQRGRQRLRDRAGPRMAATARGARAAGVDHPRPLGGAHRVPRVARGAPGRRRRGLLGMGGGPPPAPRVGACAAYPGGGVAAGDRDAPGAHGRRGAGAGTEGALAARVLGQVAGERSLTDLRHIGQLLHTAASAEQLGPTALTAWLRTRIAEADADTADEERSRRLESDAEAVQVLTIHRSKGLEFPVVYLPFLWEPGYIADKPPRPVFFHDPEAGDERTIDVALEGGGYARHREQFVREQRGEDLRLAYVALTRARHQAVVWWAGSYASRDSPLGRLLFARTDTGDVEPSGGSTPSDQAVVNRFRALAEATGGAGKVISVERSRPASATTWRPPAAPPAELGVSVFDRGLDLRWRRTSYSDITAASHEEWVTSEPEQPLLADEPPGPGVAPIAPVASGAAPPAAGAPRGGRRRRRTTCPRCWAPCPPGSTSAPSCTASWRRPTSRRSTSTPSWRPGSPTCRAAGPLTWGRPRPWRPGCGRCSRPRWGRCSATAACARWSAATASTSWASSCRSRVATGPAGR